MKKSTGNVLDFIERLCIFAMLKLEIFSYMWETKGCAAPNFSKFLQFAQIPTGRQAYIAGWRSLV